MNKNLIKNTLKIILTIGIAWLLFRQINLQDLIDLIRKISVKSMIIGIVLYMCMYVCRSLRFKILNSKNIKLKEIFNIVLVHGFYNRALPLRMGEVSYVYLMNKKHDVNISESSIVVFIARIFDLLSTLIYFIIFQAIVYWKIENIVLGLVLFVILFAMVLNLKFLINATRIILRFIKKPSKREHIQKFIDNIYDFVDENLNLKKYMYIFLISCLNWLFLYLIFYVLILDFGYEITFNHIILGASVSNLTSILPVSSFGNFGTMEVGWAMTFIAMGYSKEVAIASGFGVNMFTFVSIVIFGGIGTIVMKIMENGRAECN